MNMVIYSIVKSVEYNGGVRLLLSEHGIDEPETPIFMAKAGTVEVGLSIYYGKTGPKLWLTANQCDCAS